MCSTAVRAWPTCIPRLLQAGVCSLHGPKLVASKARCCASWWLGSLLDAVLLLLLRLRLLLYALLCQLLPQAAQRAVKQEVQ